MEESNIFGIIFGLAIVIGLIYLAIYKTKAEREAELQKKIKYEEGKSDYELKSLKYLKQISTNTNVIKILLVIYAIITFISALMIISELNKY